MLFPGLSIDDWSTLNVNQFVGLTISEQAEIGPLTVITASIFSADAISGVAVDAVTSLDHVVIKTCALTTETLYRRYSIVPDTCLDTNGDIIVGGAIVSFEGYCVWQSSDDPTWEIAGDGTGQWTITIDPNGNELWIGEKAGTLTGDTPEGVYMRLSGIDQTPYRYVHRHHHQQQTGVSE